MFAFLVDGNTLDPGGAEAVADAAGASFRGLTFADRSAVMVMPSDRTSSSRGRTIGWRSALQRVSGWDRPGPAGSDRSLASARDIAAA